MKTLHAELLLGRKVYGPDGKSIGRLHEIVAERDFEGYGVTEYLVGFEALLIRLSRVVFPILERGHSGYRVRWDQMEIGPSGELKITCPVEELTKLRRR